ncbi:MAG: hypothetical protein U9Q34_01265 [Elusimicrobiota bacterium]|nr:hypothetical protein [Elusimicrobiota bacterium]
MDNLSDNFRVASNYIHFLHGSVFFIMGITAAYVHVKEKKDQGKFRFISPLSFIIAGVLSFLVIIGVLGHWSLESAIVVMKIKPGFFIFMALSCIFVSAGVSGVLFEADRGANKFWGFFYWIFIIAIAALYAFMHTRVNSEASLFVMTHHIAMAGTLTMALIFKLTGIFTEKKVIKIFAIVFLLITSFQLLTYKENDNSFKRRVITVETGNTDISENPG